jgi:hypothetical protein
LQASVDVGPHWACPPSTVTVPTNPALHCATPFSLIDAASEGFGVGEMIHVAGLRVVGEGALSKVPTALNWTCPLGELCADAVAGVTLTETRWRGSDTPQDSVERRAEKSVA